MNESKNEWTTVTVTFPGWVPFVAGLIVGYLVHP